MRGGGRGVRAWDYGCARGVRWALGLGSGVGEAGRERVDGGRELTMKIGLQIPDFGTPRGPEWLGAELATVARTADDAGFEYIAVMDHFFQIPAVGPTENEMLEGYTTLGYLAACTRRAALLTVITGVHYREPGILAKIVTTLDVLSNGRAWRGVGAGWNEEESRGLGVPFPPVAERFERLEETLQICLQMWHGDERGYRGKHYTLERPPPPPPPRPPPPPPPPDVGGGRGGEEDAPPGRPVRRRVQPVRGPRRGAQA